MKFSIDTDTWTITHSDGRSISWFDDEGFRLLSDAWLAASWQRKYSYQFKWLGRPIIQLPQDIVLMQDLLARVRPTLVIETGIAHGGSAVLHASILKMIHATNTAPAPHVVAIDIDIRAHNRQAIDEHALRPMMTLIEGSSVDASIVAQAAAAVRPGDRVLVVLDSNHLRDHVLAELNAYAPLVSKGSALVVMDGIMRDLAALPNADRSWRTDNPISAIDAFRSTPLGKEFDIDASYDGFACTHSPGGILLRNRGGR